MCIIVYKPQGINSPSWHTLQNCFNSNPHGAGFMFAENGQVIIHKGFLSWRSFKTAFKPYKNRKDLPIVLHFRITTHGSTCRELCHPFPLSDSKADLKALDIKSNIGIAHNGIIPLTTDAPKGMSDTSEFIRVYAKYFITGTRWYKDRPAVRSLEEILHSKMLVLTSDGHGERVGSGWRSDDGVWYSNDSYEDTETIWDIIRRHDDDIYGYTKNDGSYGYRYDDDGYLPTYCKYWYDEDGYQIDEPSDECLACSDLSRCW